MTTHIKASVLLTAGHAATTALATIEALQADPHVDWNISWIGPARALESSHIKPFELELFPKLGVSVYSITAGKLQSKFTRHTVPALLKTPVGFWQAFFLLRRIKPQVIVSFGGFASVPVSIVGYLLGIPVVLHEQTVAAGLANRITGKFAKTIALARSESGEYFDKRKTVVTGNPLTKEVLSVKQKTLLHKTPVVYVTGGSRGSLRLNAVVYACLPRLLKKYKIIHQTGVIDYQKAKDIRDSLPSDTKSHYEVFSFTSPSLMSTIYDQIDVLVGRSGANTVSEALAVGIPSLFIPIPWTRNDEQGKNARFAAKHGTALVIHEADLTNETFEDAIDTLVQNWSQFAQASKNVNSLDRNAAHELVSVIANQL